MTELPTIDGDPLPPQHPKLAALLALWTQKAAGGALPLRRDLSPFDLQPWLGNISLLEVLEGGRDFRYRVHGTAMVNLTQVEMTGKRVSHGPARHRASVLEEYRSALAHGRPFRLAHMSRPSRPDHGWEKLILPLSHAGDGIDYLLSAMYPAPRSTDWALPPVGPGRAGRTGGLPDGVPWSVATDPD